MTRIDINGSDSSTLHLFHLDLPDETVERFTTMAGTGEWPLKYALGADRLRAEAIDIVRLKDLEPMRLSQYLQQAHDVPARALDNDATRLDALRGHVLILPPRAFDHTSQTLTVAPPLVHLGRYGETRPTPRGAPLHSDASTGAPSGGAPAQPERGGSRLLKLLLAGIGIVILLTLAMVLRG